MNWQIGDKAVIIQAHLKPAAAGQECEVMGPSHLNGYLYVDVPILGEPACRPYWSTLPENLRPIPDHYDGLKISSWDESPFKPKELCDVDIG